MLNTKRTVLSLALAASLACVGNYAAADDCDPLTGACTYTYDGEITLSQIVPESDIHEGYDYEIKLTNAVYSELYGIRLTDFDDMAIGNVVFDITVSDSASEPTIKGIYIGGGSPVVIGNVVFNLTGIMVNGGATSCVLYVNTSSAAEPSVKVGDIAVNLDFSSDTTINYGNIVGVQVSEGTVETGSISMIINSPDKGADIYGIYADGGTVTAKDVSVSVIGSASQGTNSIYGTYEFGDAEITVGTRTLNFGSEDSKFTSSESNYFSASFGGFDELVIFSGSSLYISGQTSSLGANVDGITSSGDTLTLPADTTLTVQAEASLYSPTISATSAAITNNGTLTADAFSAVNVTIDGSGTITAGTFNVTSGTLDNSSEITSDTFTVTNGRVTNTSTITAGSLTVDGTSRGLTFANKGVVVVTGTLRAGNGDFRNGEQDSESSGTISAGRLSVGDYSTFYNYRGTISADSASIATALYNYDELIVSGNIHVGGTLSNEKSGYIEAGSIELTDAIHNYGTIISNGLVDNIRGTFTNEDGGYLYASSLAVEAYYYFSMYRATTRNNAGATIEAGDLTIKGGNFYNSDSTTESGTATLKVYGTLTVQVGSYDERYISGVFTNYATGYVEASEISVESGSEFNNYGTIIVDTTSITNENGHGESFVSYEGAVFTTDSLTTGTDTDLTNYGTLNILAASSDSSIGGTITNNGTTYINPKGGTGTVAIAAGGKVYNNGQFFVSEDASLVIQANTGTFYNYSYFEAESVVTIYGDFANGVLSGEEIGEAVFHGITVEGRGYLGNFQGSTFYDYGTTYINNVSTEFNAVVDNSYMYFADLELVGGYAYGIHLTGLTTDDPESNRVHIYEGGKVDALHMTFDTIINDGELSVGSLFRVEEKGELTVGKVFTNGAENDGASATFYALNPEFGAVINAYGGTITVDYLQLSDTATTNYDKVTYNQTNGTILINEGGGWFEDSTLNIMGGHLDMTNDDETPTSETLGKNIVNISLAGATMPTAADNPLDGDWYDNETTSLTWVKTKTLGSDTIVNIESGGVLIVTDEISLTGENTLNIKGGALQTTLDQIFNGVYLEAILVDATEAGSVEIDSDIYATSVGSIKDSILTGMTGTSGNIVFTDNFTVDVLTAVSNSLSSSGYNLTVNYLGEMAGEFTIDTALALKTEGATYVDNPGIVLNNTTLTSTTESGGDQTSLTIGSGGDIDLNIGFKNVAVANEITIQGGSEFVLVGDSSGQYKYNDEASKLLIDSEGGTVTVSNGTFTLGTLGASVSSVGWVDTVELEASGALNAKNGEFAAWTISNKGTVTVDASAVLHTNSLTGSGTVTNNGSLVVETNGSSAAVLTVEGTFENNGTLTADAVDTVTVSGTLKNAGTLTSNNIDVSGTAENTGTWTTSDTITISGEGNIANSGNITTNALVMEDASSIGNNADSTFTVTGSTTVDAGASLLNEGTFDAQGDLTVESTGQLVNDTNGTLTIGGDGTINGQLDNDGTVTVSGTLTAADEGLIANGGTIEGDGTLAVEGTGRVVNAASIKTSSLTIADSGSVTSGGSNASISVDSLSISSGSLEIQDGTLTVGSSELSGGEIALGSSSAVSVELGEPTGDVGSQISVLNGSRLSLGLAEYGLDWADSETGSSLGNLLVVSSPITTNDTGGISVGAEATDAGLYFSADSTLVVNVDALNGSAAFTTTSGSTATVESGATLVVGGTFSKGYSYSIIEGYTDDIAENSWGYITDNEDYLYGEDTSGLKWTMHLISEDGKIYVQAVEHEDVSNVYDLAVPNIANDELDYASKGSFVEDILRDDSLSKEDKEKIINSAANLAFAGGVMATTLTDATAAIDSVHNHLTMDGDTFGKDGNLWPWDKNNNLWVDLLGSFQHGKHLNASAISGYKYRTNTVGLVLGYDHKLEDRPVVLGGAFSFSDGNLKSKGGVSRTKNEYQTYGVSLFANYSPSPAFNLIGSLHWFHNSADIKQYSSSGKVTGKVQTNLAAVGLRGETTLKAGQVNFVPHVEARYIYGKSGKFTTKFDGVSAWNTKADGTHTVQFPVGIAARTDIKTESGWNIRPKADLSFIPQVGSTKQKSVVRSSDGVSDTIDGQFMGKFGGSVKLGVQADKGNATVGLRYGFLGGTKGRADHSVMLQGRIRF